MNETPSCAVESVHFTAERLPPEPGRAEFDAAFLYAATSHSLDAWACELGIRVRHVGIAYDPLEQISGFRGSGYADVSYGLSFLEEDGSLDDWELSPLDVVGCGATPPRGCLSWGGAVRFQLPPGASIGDVQSRFAMFMAPLEAVACAQLPSAVERRHSSGKFLPVTPRYKLLGGSHAVVQDLYRIEGPSDVAYLLDALDAALVALGPDRDVFDRCFASLSNVPSLEERGWAVDPART